MVPQPALRLVRDGRILAGGIALLLLASALAPFILAQPNPSGPSVPVALVDAGDARHATYEGRLVASVGTVLRPLDGKLRFDVTYDLTFTNISLSATGYGYGESLTSTGLRLHAPDGSSVPNARDLYPDGSRPGKYNVTFPSVRLGQTGVWTLRDGTGSDVSRAFVGPAETLGVTVSPNLFQETSDFVSFTVDVTPPQANVELRGGGIPPGTRTDADGRYVFFGPIGGPGTYRVEALLDLGGATLDGAPIHERVGAGTYVVEAALVPAASPERVVVGRTTPVDVTLRYANNLSGAAGKLVRLCGAPIGGCTGEATTDATGRATLLVTPTTLGRLDAYERENLTTASVEVVHQVVLALDRTLAYAGETIRFEATLEAGGPADNATLLLRRAGHADLAYSMGPTGVISLQPPVGAYTAIATQAGAENGTATFVIEAAPPTTLRVRNAAAGPLLDVGVPILLENASDVGTLTVDLAYDPSVMTVTGLAPGNVTGANLTWRIDDANGTLRILLVTTDRPGPSGTFVVANLSVRAAGLPGSVTALDLNATEAAFSDGSAMPVAVADGTFRSGLLGDVNADNLLDQADVAALSEYVVGLRGPGEVVVANADVTRDGRVTGLDAMFLAQHLAGTRDEL